MIGRTNTGGGGGGGLNFKVVGNPQPSNPKENIVWVNTDVKITSYDFNAIEPETPVQGMVWFSIGISSTVAFNALKKNSIQVYPLYAKQYVNGAWVNVTAMSYQSGKWVDWITYLYNKGNTYDDFTGGIKAYAYKVSTSGSTAVTPTLTNSNGVITVTVSTNNQIGSMFVENAIDLTHFSTIEINVTSRNANASTITMFVSKTKANNYTMAASIALNNTGKIPLHIGDLPKGEYYIGIVLGGGGSKSFAFDSWGLK